MKIVTIDRKNLQQVLSVLVLLFADSVFSLSTETPDQNKSCLWRAQSSNTSVYLLGSVHLMKSENYPLNPVIEKAFDESEIVMFEVNLDSAESLRTQRYILSKAMDTGGKMLRERLSEKTYDLASQKLRDVGLSIEQFEPFKSWFLTITVMGLRIRRLGFDPEFGIDRYFFGKAKNSGKAVSGLETIEFQIALFDELSNLYQDDFMLQSLEELDLLDQEIQKIMDAWTSGDIQSLETMVLRSFTDYPEIYDVFIVKRNQNWLSQIERMLNSEKTVMVVVGCGHLLGQDGLVALFRSKGYVAEQL